MKNGGGRDWIITEKERAENGKTGETGNREREERNIAVQTYKNDNELLWIPINFI